MDRPGRIVTRRLVLTPLQSTDAAGLCRVAGDECVARETATVPHPFTRAAARSWIADSPFHGGFDLRFAIRRWGRMVGMVGLGGVPAALGYMIARHAWGRGYATEAAGGLLAALNPREKILAKVFADNVGSVRVLEKLGFQPVGESIETTALRPGGAPTRLFRLLPDRSILS
ncbi:MAG: GNAT family N-acetyltransferase [Pseudomonadota bacterium]